MTHTLDLRIGILVGLITLAGCQEESTPGDEGNDDAHADGGSQTLNGCEVDAYQADMLEQVNAARATGRTCGSTDYPATHALEYHCKLDEAAETHSQDMAENNFFSHTGSDGLSVADRVTSTGYAWSAVGENIAAGQPTVDDVMQGWLDSPGHCKNIMGDQFQQFGTSKVDTDSADYSTYWTQVFGTQRD